MRGRWTLAPDGEHAIDSTDGGLVPIAVAHDDRHGGLVVRCCPLCGKRHFHGWGPGLRVSDCRVHTSRRGYLLVLANDLQRVRAGAKINL